MGHPLPVPSPASGCIQSRIGEPPKCKQAWTPEGATGWRRPDKLFNLRHLGKSGFGMVLAIPEAESGELQRAVQGANTLGHGAASAGPKHESAKRVKASDCRGPKGGKLRSGHKISRLLTRSSGLGSACRAEDGGTLVELAFTMPVICFLLTGFFVLTNVMHQKLEFSEAVAAGSRFLSTDRGDTDPCAAAATKIYAAAPLLNQSNMSLTFNINGTPYPTATCSGTTSMVSGGTATVSAKYTCTYAGVYGLNLGPCTLYESTTQVIQ